MSDGPATRRPVVVHITADFPDAHQPRKTSAIAELVRGTADRFDHRVYSLNRVSPAGGDWARPGAVTVVADDGEVASWTYAAPGGGLMLPAAMRRVAAHVLDDLAKRGIRPDLIQGHKLSVEGLAAAPVAAALGVPYALSLQGNTDQRFLRAHPQRRAAYAAAWRGAAALFPFSPWIARWCEARLGAPAAAPIVLPCVLARDSVLAPRPAPDKVVTAFHLEHHRLKNIDRLAAAVGRAAQTAPDLRFEIGGGGPPGARVAVRRAIERAGVADRAALLGPVAPADMQAWMNGAAAFAMPSLRESFGMVFLEAMLAGCPIVYPAGRAVDGYFDGCGFALAVPPRDTGAIADAIAELVRDQAGRKEELARWQRGPAAAAFRRDAILGRYAAGLRSAMSS